jgi:hypothetical protein
VRGHFVLTGADRARAPRLGVLVCFKQSLTLAPVARVHDMVFWTVACMHMQDPATDNYIRRLCTDLLQSDCCHSVGRWETTSRHGGAASEAKV